MKTKYIFMNTLFTKQCLLNNLSIKFENIIFYNYKNNNEVYSIGV